MVIARTDMAYPSLWVAPGSKDTAVGRHFGMQEDFVTGGCRRQAVLATSTADSPPAPPSQELDPRERGPN